MRKFKSRTIERPRKFGDNLVIENYAQLEDLYKNGKLHPVDLKKATMEAVDQILIPVRNYFSKGKAKELYEIVRDAKVTR